MLINNADRRQALEDARVEFGSHQIRELPDDTFYESRLRAAWERARRSRRYADLPEFSFARFRRARITAKDELKAAPSDFLAVDVRDCQKYYETTGTSGRSTPTPRLAEDIIWNSTSVAEAWRPVLREDDRIAILLPSDIVPVGDLVAGTCEYLDLPHVRAYPFCTGIAEWERISEMWHTFRPTVVYVAPGVALHLTRLARSRQEIDSMAASVRALMLLGEVSTPAFRRQLGRWWNAEALDASYGSTETGTLAATCARGQLHLLPVAAHFELDVGTEVVPVDQPGEGRLVVTPLHLHARPLLRFDTGDVVRLSVGCDCGSAVPTVTVRGRATDQISVRGVALTPRDVESVVFGSPMATAYMLEVDQSRGRVRLLLERDTDIDRASEGRLVETVQRRSEDELGLRWDEVTFLNSLPAIAKSGASQKSWKRSNVRMVGSPS